MRTKTTDQAGFTAVELMVALVAAGAIMAISLTTLTRATARWQTRQAAQNIAASIRATRTLAIRTHTVQAMAVDGGTGRYTDAPRGASTSMPSTVDTLPYGLTFLSPTGSTNAVSVRYPATNETAFAFSDRGRLLSSIMPAMLYVGDGRRGTFARVVVDMSGATRVQYWDGQWH